MTQDFGQAPRYHLYVIALRAPHCLTLGIVSLLAAGTWVARPAPQIAAAPNISAPPPPEQLSMRWQHLEPSCDPDAFTSVVIRGQFTSTEHQHEGFAISFAGSEGYYTAMTDHRGYFEVRMPREDFDGDFCKLPRFYKDFTDAQMTLSYSIDIER